MSRVFNFSAGPAVLPLQVLKRARDEMTDWQGSGMSVMEMSHRGAEFGRIASDAERDLRRLLAIPENYRVLFLQGGATSQFAAIPLNLTAPGQTVDYVNTGNWSRKAIGEAGKYCNVNVVADAADSRYTTGIDPRDWQLSDDARYVHYTPNETIGGVEFLQTPDAGDRPLVADASSTILSRPIDVSRFGLIYAGAQKNIGPAGLCLVIVRDDLLGQARPDTPMMLEYAGVAAKGSMLNTPPTYAWYVASLVFGWLLEQGGLAAIGERNRRKKDALYAAIDASAFYSNPVHPDYRSWMNIPFTLANPERDAQFLDEAREAGLVNLKGHRSVGGMRASIYNAMPFEGVQALIDFMADFERRRG